MSDRDQFQHYTKKQWLEKVQLDLKGRELSDLDWHINQQLIISPFKDQSDLSYAGTQKYRACDNSWISMEPIYLSDDLHQGNTSIMKSLQGGMNGLRIHTPSLLTVDQLTRLFRDVYIDMLHIDFVLDTQVDVLQQINELESYAALQDRELDALSISIDSIENELDYHLLGSDPNRKVYTINGLQYYNDRSDIAQELGHIIYHANHLIQHASEEQLGDLYSSLHYKIAIDDCYLLNIAAIRALRHLIKQLFEIYQLTTDSEIFISAIYPDSSMSLDINYDRIKTSSAALSAVIAGANTIQIFNPKMNSDEPEEFRRKICRNVFHLLSMESYVDRVVDPAAGSYYIESLTEQVAKAAWTFFQQKWSSETSISKIV